VRRQYRSPRAARQRSPSPSAIAANCRGAGLGGGGKVLATHQLALQPARAPQSRPRIRADPGSHPNQPQAKQWTSVAAHR